MPYSSLSNWVRSFSSTLARGAWVDAVDIGRTEPPHGSTTGCSFCRWGPRIPRVGEILAARFGVRRNSLEWSPEMGICMDLLNPHESARCAHFTSVTAIVHFSILFWQFFSGAHQNGVQLLGTNMNQPFWLGTNLFGFKDLIAAWRSDGLLLPWTPRLVELQGPDEGGLEVEGGFFEVGSATELLVSPGGMRKLCAPWMTLDGIFFWIL